MIEKKTMFSIVLQLADLMHDVADDVENKGPDVDKESLDTVLTTAKAYLYESYDEAQFTTDQWKRMEETAVAQYVISYLEIIRRRDSSDE